MSCEAVFDVLQVQAQAVLDAHAEVAAGEVVGDGVGGGQVGEGVVALGQIGRHAVGLLGELEAGAVEQALLEALLYAQVVDEQRDGIDDEEQQRNEVLAR